MKVDFFVYMVILILKQVSNINEISFLIRYTFALQPSSFIYIVFSHS